MNISDLEIIEEPMTITAKQMRRTSTGKMKMSKSLAVSPEINLLGKTVDELSPNWINIWMMHTLHM